MYFVVMFDTGSMWDEWNYNNKGEYFARYGLYVVLNIMFVISLFHSFIHSFFAWRVKFAMLLHLHKKQKRSLKWPTF